LVKGAAGRVGELCMGSEGQSLPLYDRNPERNRRQRTNQMKTGQTLENVKKMDPFLIRKWRKIVTITSLTPSTHHSWGV